MAKCCLHYIFCKRMFRYDNVFGGAFWYTNVYKEYGVIWYTFVKSGYCDIFRRNNENLSDSLRIHVFSSYDTDMRNICFDAETRVPTNPVLSGVKYHRNINHGIWYWKFRTFNLDSVLNTLLSYDVAVIRWLTSWHKNRMTTRYITLDNWRVTSWRRPWQRYVFYRNNVIFQGNKIPF